MSEYTEKPEESLDQVEAAVEVELAAPVVEEVAEVVEAPKPAPPSVAKKKHADPVKVDTEDIGKDLPVPAGPAVVSNGEKDIVKVSAIIFQNEIARKSLSVHHLQRRLAELGYADSLKDKDGYFGVNTRRALLSFQEQNNLTPDGVASLESLKKLFTNDPNVDLQP